MVVSLSSDLLCMVLDHLFGLLGVCSRLSPPLFLSQLHTHMNAGRRAQEGFVLVYNFSSVGNFLKISHIYIQAK